MTFHSLAQKDSALSELIETLCDVERENHFKSVAILIDEYDYPILHTLHNQVLSIEIRNILKSFSCVIKAEASLVQFVFITGVSAFSKSGLSSGLNNLKNLTLDAQFATICGYTEEEIDLYFKEYVKKWTQKENIDCDLLREDLKSWYNGYRFEEESQTVYNPFSFTCAIDIQKRKNFWFESATPQFLLDELT